MYLLKHATRSVSFAFGNIRTQPSFPWITTGVRENKISLGEALEAVATARFGDVGMRRASGYLTNLVIPGAMKHTWIHTHDVESKIGQHGGLIVEATAKGVQSRNAVIPYLSDYAVILRPKQVTEEERKGACLKANDIVGADYDTSFKFNIEEQLKFYDVDNEDDKEEALASLKSSEAALRKWNLAFSCSEVVAYSWWHCRKPLRIYRRDWLSKKDVILPVDFMHSGFEIVWCSASWTVDIASKQGLGEEALDMLACWKNRGYL